MKTLVEKLREDARLLEGTAEAPAFVIARLREAADALESPDEDTLKEALLSWEGAIYEDEHGGAAPEKLEEARENLLTVLRRCRAAFSGEWKLVPIEPTDEMRIAGGKYRDEAGGRRTVGGYWRAMISATPKP